MRRKKKYVLAAIGISAVLCLAGVSAEENTAEQQETETKDDRVSFRPVDCGVQPMEEYEFPFLGMTMKLSEELLEKLDTREVFGFTMEEYADDTTISYAVMRVSATTEEQRAEEGMSVDIFSWEESLEKIGAVGVYQKEEVTRLDELTACDSHEKIGESADGAYEYYLSINTSCDEKLTAEWKKTECSFGEMHAFDASQGYTAFSEDRVDGVGGITFATEDVFGEAYTEEVFQDYDLTLVNVFATWCSPCVAEMPELEKLRQKYEEDGKKLGILAVVLDTKTQFGVDEGAIERAQLLKERSGAQFPFLIPDDGNMNERLTGIQSVPESFFVDGEGKIVSDPYVGARSLEGWSEIVDQELEKITVS